jgi:hypothetical protein
MAFSSVSMGSSERSGTEDRVGVNHENIDQKNICQMSVSVVVLKMNP